MICLDTIIIIQIFFNSCWMLWILMRLVIILVELCHSLLHFNNFLFLIIVADLIKELNLLRKVLPLQADALEKVHVWRQLVTVNDLLLIEQGNLDLLTELVTKEYLVEVTQIRSDDHLAESGQIKLLFLQV